VYKRQGLQPEVAWNIGANATKEFLINQRSLLIGLDYYYTWFDQQVVVDWENPRKISFYNLEGDSYSHAVQAQLDYALSDRIDLRMAYRYNDVQTDYADGRLLKPLTPRDRAFFNTAIDFGKGWTWDGTLTWQGTARLPSTLDNPPEYQALEISPNIFNGLMQLTKSWNSGWAIYVGSENLFNYQQENPIISADDPFEPFFDASLIYAPIFGRNIYAGMRWSVR